ncbi:hypothetical protein PMIN01_02784 [Paraphaeosphaeria minitans]|uniref:Uncharacterized protein n=1 Tax=Paraphaeosphaeria minitans TaxID=565426 RepID=A0A9P6GTW6_9PLEO|nr:hypothetical protein PMIN01_02784 [Paraphaeosphaeria minitans]
MRVDLHIAVAPRAMTSGPTSAPQKHNLHHHKRRALQRRASKLLSGRRSTSCKSNHHRPRQPSTPERGSMPDDPVQHSSVLSPGPEDRLTVVHTLPWDLCYDGPPQDAAAGRFGNLAAPTTEPDESRETASAVAVQSAVPDNGAANVAPAVQGNPQDHCSSEQSRLKPLVCWDGLFSLASLWYFGGTDHS